MKKTLHSVMIFCLSTSISSSLFAQQCENGGFENGTYTSTYGTADPTDWGTVNFDDLGLPQTTTLETIAPYEGATNVKMTTMTGHAALGIDDTVAGHIFSKDLFGTTGVYDFRSVKLQSISFRYKSILINDTALVLAQLYDDAGTVLGEGEYRIGGTVATWTEVNMPIGNITGTPDSMLFVASSSEGSWPLYYGPTEPEPNSVLELDNIVFCDTFAIDFDTTTTGTGLTVDFTSMTSATGNDGNGSLSWDFGDGTGTSTDLNPSYTFPSDGTFDVMLTVVDSCGNDSTFTKSLTLTSDGSSLSENDLQQLSIYPNPVQNKVSVRADNIISSIEVIDATGKVIYTEEIDAQKAEINSSEWNSGVYVLKAKMNNTTIVRRIVK